jgi:hypothetical protein
MPNKLLYATTLNFDEWKVYTKARDFIKIYKNQLGSVQSISKTLTLN